MLVLLVAGASLAELGADFLLLAYFLVLVTFAFTLYRDIAARLIPRSGRIGKAVRAVCRWSWNRPRLTLASAVFT